MSLYIDLALVGVSEVNQSDLGPSPLAARSKE